MLTSLRSLSLDKVSFYSSLSNSDPTIINLKALFKLPTLCRLNLCNMALTPKALTGISALTNLEDLNLGGNSVSEEIFKVVFTLTTLKKLNVFPNLLCQQNLDEQFHLETFENFTKLQRLNTLGIDLKVSRLVMPLFDKVTQIKMLKIEGIKYSNTKIL